MHKLLLEMALKEAVKNLELQGLKNPSNQKKAEELSRAVTQPKFTYDPRNFTTLISKLDQSETEITIKQPKVLKGLAKYCGYDDYEDFAIKNNVKKDLEEKKKREREKAKSLKITIIISAFTILSFVVIHFTTRQRWMTWDKDHYVEVSFNAEKAKNGDLKLYKKERILYFKRIIPTCETVFFKEDGGVKVWYGKNEKGELQYFTDLGLHPETGKTLKEITPYMIAKYICPGY